MVPWKIRRRLSASYIIVRVCRCGGGPGSFISPAVLVFSNCFDPYVRYAHSNGSFLRRMSEEMSNIKAERLTGLKARQQEVLVSCSNRSLRTSDISIMRLR
jgi:hypothetical protein